MKELVILGAGGHALSVIDCIDRSKFNIKGFIDKNKTGECFGIPVISDRIEDIPCFEDCVYFVAIGDNEIRKRCFEEITTRGLTTVNIVDKNAIISESAVIGTGNFIGKGSIINAHAVIGDNNIINTRALIEHGCVLGNHIHLSTGAVLNGEVTVCDLALIGSNSTCICQKTIGESAILGAGCVVTTNISADTTVAGVPAKPINRGNTNE